MPGRRDHQLAGLVAGGIASGVAAHHANSTQQTLEVIGGLVGGVIGGAMPDVIEPAVSSHHRKFAHSVVAGGAITLAGIIQMQANCRARAQQFRDSASALALNSPERNRQELIAAMWFLLAGLIIGLAAGYISHLALDAHTPRGIPVI